MFNVILALLVGCDDDKRPSAQQTTIESTQEATDLPKAQTVSTTVEVVDDAGRKVIFEKVPKRILSLAPANTELVFDGDSQVQSAAGEVLWHAPLFEEAFFVWDTDDPGGPVEARAEGGAAAVTAQIHDALVLGVRDYVRKTGEGVFEKALVGLSGGIDSAVTCAIAVEALGADRVVGITMPSAYSSSGSVDDSRALAENLGIEFHEVSIRPAVDAFADSHFWKP